MNDVFYWKMHKSTHIWLSRMTRIDWSLITHTSPFIIVLYYIHSNIACKVLQTRRTTWLSQFNEHICDSFTLIQYSHFLFSPFPFSCSSLCLHTFVSVLVFSGYIRSLIKIHKALVDFYAYIQLQTIHRLKRSLNTQIRHQYIGVFFQYTFVCLFRRVVILKIFMIRLGSFATFIEGFWLLWKLLCKI